jgi:hypothetical protein
MTRRAIPFLVVALLTLPVALAACGGGSTEVGAAPSTEIGGSGVAAGCAMVVRYEGHDYIGREASVRPVQGESLGNGTFPPCSDTGGLEPSHSEPVPIAEVQGVSPTIAIMLAGRPDVVLVREDVLPNALPGELFPR